MRYVDCPQLMAIVDFLAYGDWKGEKVGHKISLLIDRGVELQGLIHQLLTEISVFSFIRDIHIPARKNKQLRKHRGWGSNSTTGQLCTVWKSRMTGGLDPRACFQGCRAAASRGGSSSSSSSSGGGTSRRKQLLFGEQSSLAASRGHFPFP